MWVALTSTIAQAGGLILDKIILSRHRVGLKFFLVTTFGITFLLTLALTPWLGHFNPRTALAPSTLFLLGLMVLLATAWNILMYQSLQKETVHHNELMLMLLPLLTVIMAAIFFPQNFSWPIFVLSIVASLSLLFAKSSREHFIIGPHSYNALLAVVMMATENIIIKELLYSFSPVTLYAIRVFFITVIMMVYYRPALSGAPPMRWLRMGESAVVGMVQMLTQYYAYANLGIIYTTLFTALAPVLVFLASWEILHEHIRLRTMIAAIIIALCVVIGTVINFK